jgi:hypothetical protein
MLVQYLALIGYVLPTRARDRVYQFVSKRRQSCFGSSDECLLWDDRFEDRFVDDVAQRGLDKMLFFLQRDSHSAGCTRQTPPNRVSADSLSRILPGDVLESL